jgi:pyruvate dehydrogenase E1 component alpha subunit
MISSHDLISFEDEIAELFNNGLIKAPVHLYSGAETPMMEVFKDIDIEHDWVCCTWRNHYQALLKGIPREIVKQEILDGKSMVMNLPEYKFLCSSIVGGIPSIATGIALALRHQKKAGRVWCWVGDMSAETGAFHEALKYSVNHNLPITFVVEDNAKSVCTPTREVWRTSDYPYYIDADTAEFTRTNAGVYKQPHLYYYRYTNFKYPHAGAGKRVQF